MLIPIYFKVVVNTEETDALRIFDQAVEIANKGLTPEHIRLIFDNQLEPTKQQAEWLRTMPDCQPLEQTRSGNIIVCDKRNPYRPLYVLTPTGHIEDIHTYYHLTD